MAAASARFRSRCSFSMIVCAMLQRAIMATFSSSISAYGVHTYSSERAAVPVGPLTGEGPTILVASARAAVTDEEFARARPADEVMPDFVAAWRRSRGKQVAPVKVAISARLDADVVAALRAGGRGWQTGMNRMLREALGLDRKGR